MSANEVTIVDCLTLLCEAFGKPMSKAKVAAYRIGLSGLDDAAVHRATQAALTTSKFMPSPAELRELGGVLKIGDRAEVAWIAFDQALSRYGTHHTITFDDVTINAVVRSLGGLHMIADTSAEDYLSFTRARFLKAYEALARSGVGEEASAPLLGDFDKENAANGYGDAVKKAIVITTGLLPGTSNPALPNASHVKKLGE